jgi:hypothetical protein
VPGGTLLIAKVPSGDTFTLNEGNPELRSGLSKRLEVVLRKRPSKPATRPLTLYSFVSSVMVSGAFEARTLTARSSTGVPPATIDFTW